jgi:hypothetical protein
VLLSAFAALSLAPALCAMLLKPHHGPAKGPAGKILRWFNRVFDRTTNAYSRLAQLLCAAFDTYHRHRRRGGHRRRPFRRLGCPRASSRRKIRAYLASTSRCRPRRLSNARVGCSPRSSRSSPRPEGVDSFSTIGGYGVVTSTYQPELRHDFRPDEAVGRALFRCAPCARHHGKLAAAGGEHSEAIVFPFNIPTISGFGASAGFNFLLQDRSGALSVQQLGDYTRPFHGRGAQAARVRQPLHLL